MYELYGKIAQLDNEKKSFEKDKLEAESQLGFIAASEAELRTLVSEVEEKMLKCESKLEKIERENTNLELQNDVLKKDLDEELKVKVRPISRPIMFLAQS